MRARITRVEVNRDPLERDTHITFTAIIKAEDEEGQAEIIACAEVSGELELGPISVHNLSTKELGQLHRLVGAEMVRRLQIASAEKQRADQRVKSEARDDSEDRRQTSHFPNCQKFATTSARVRADVAAERVKSEAGDGSTMPPCGVCANKGAGSGCRRCGRTA